MKKLIMSAYIFLVFLTGCSNYEEYNNAVKKGNDYIISEEYQKAESAFELALDEKMNDERVTALLTQTVIYQELIEEFNEGNFDLAKENADEVIQIENGSSTLVEQTEEILEIMEVLEKKLTMETEKYEIALSHFEDAEYDEASVQLENILDENPEHPIFDSLIENIDKLNEDIESALLVEKNEKERKERETEEKEKQEEAESIATYEAEQKVEKEEKSQDTYETETKENNGKEWKPRDEYEADMKIRNEVREKSREAYDAEMKQRNADRDKRNRERNY